jgi:hypothetical protein
MIVKKVQDLQKHTYRSLLKEGYARRIWQTTSQAMEVNAELL